MIDPLSHGPALDLFMGGSSGSPSAAGIFADLKRKAEAARAQAQARNPGAQLPPVDEAELMQKAQQIAAGTPPEDTVDPRRLEAGRQLIGDSALGGDEGAPEGGPGMWGRMGRNFQGEEIPAEAARAARFKGLTDAGIAMLGSAGEGNLGKGLAQGLAAFQGGMGSELEGFTGRRRQGELDDLRRRSTEESLESSRAARERARVSSERESTAFAQSQEDRRAALEAMRDQLREIEELAGDGPEAARARALMKGGPELQGDLDELHQSLISRKRFPEDRAMETDAEIERLRRIFSEDPQARHERSVEERRLDAYERWGGEAGGLSDAGYLSALDRERRWQFDTLLKSRERYGELPPDVDVEALREEAERKAEEALRRRMGGRDPGGGGEAGRPAPVSEKEVAAVKQSLETRMPSQVREALRTRGVPDDKIDELLYRAGVRE